MPTEPQVTESNPDDDPTMERPPEAPAKAEGLEEQDKASMKGHLAKAKKEFEEMGGWANFKSGNWLFQLIQRSFKAYYQNANDGYFRAKYPGLDSDQIADKLSSIAARNSALLGSVTGAVISADEIVALVTGGEALIGIPANVAIAISAACGEIIFLTRIQLQLVANLAKLYGVPLDPDDPEDVLTILAYAIGGAAAEAAGKAGMKVGGFLTKQAVRRYIRKEVLEALQQLGRKIGVKILQKTIIKYAVPIVSMVIGGGWNYLSTRSVAKIARKHFKTRGRDAGKLKEAE